MKTRGRPRIKNKITPKTVKTTLSSITTYSSVIYALVLILSISYNIGYFKFINPQVVEVMAIGDYIEFTTHNIWFFLLATVMFFCSSLGFIKNDNTKRQLRLIIIFSCFSLVISICCFLKGTYNSHFWPTIKILLANSQLLFVAVIAAILFVVLLGFIIYTIELSLKGLSLPTYLVSVMSIVIFLTLVLLPYLGGMIAGYIEIYYIRSSDCKAQTVNVLTNNSGEILKDVFVIKKLEKGIVLQQFPDHQEPSKSKVFLLLWGDIKRIEYKLLQS